MEINTMLTIPEAYVNGELIAKIDNTYSNDIKVILVDEPTKYIQRFFTSDTLDSLVERTQLMRRIGIESL